MRSRPPGQTKASRSTRRLTIGQPGRRRTKRATSLGSEPSRWSSCCPSIQSRLAFAFALRTPAVGNGRLGNLGYYGSCQAVGGNELGPLTVHGRQVGLARVVADGH